MSDQRMNGFKYIDPGENEKLIVLPAVCAHFSVGFIINSALIRYKQRLDLFLPILSRFDIVSHMLRRRVVLFMAS